MEIACPKCRHANPPAAKFCLQCGAQLNEISQNRSSDPLVGRQVGNLRLVKRIGSGGMGVVYLAEHVNLGKPYAIKFLHPQFAADQEVVERFRREARVIASLDHENIIRETDFGWFDGFGFYLVMEYLEGKTLKQVIRGGEALPPARILNLFEQLCGALEEAHEKDIVHRDLKPENLFLLQRRGREVLKILDFGIARIAQTGIPSEFTVDGEVYGSPTYMSPEQARGDLSQITPRSDLYSVGVILFEAVSGRTPFQGKTPTEVMLGHITHTPPRLSDIRPDLPPNPALEALLAKALAKDPSQRFASAWQIYESLRAAFRPQKDELESTYDDRPEEDTTTLDMDGDVSAVLSDPQRFLQQRSNPRERESLAASSPFVERSIHRAKQPPQEPCEKDPHQERRDETANTGSFVGSKSISTTTSELVEDSQAAGKSAQSWPPQTAPSSTSYPNVQGSLPPLNANLSRPSATSQHPERSISGLPSPFLPRSSETSLAGVPSPLPQALAPSSPNALPFPGLASPPPLSQSPLSRLPAPPTVPMPAPSFLEMMSPQPPSSSHNLAPLSSPHSPAPLSLPPSITSPNLSPPSEKDISTTDAATSVVLLPDRDIPCSPQPSAQEAS
ncbi:protein kinase, partial [Myxococcota bacterium]|nr:protein kinase [Myxococcota bacterium]